ncbi:beta-lactamase/transpeptidase-like protein [Camillea tinctor]|nr:beta-lactamase/transpeptidase-like protein [Camillea tinctor]
MLRTVTTIFLGITILAASPTVNRLRHANSKVDQICKASGVPGASIGVIHDGEIIHTYNYGSITKSFIAAAIARLVDENVLRWDTPVKDILPDGAMNLAFEGNGNMLLSKDRLFELVNHFPTLFPFLQSWSYFVWGYSIAGAIIEKVTRKSLDDYLSDTIFHPLGMNETSLTPNRLGSRGELAEPYAGLSDGISFRLPKLQAFGNTFFEASGGIYSSLNDLMTWASTILSSTDRKTPANLSAIKDVPYILSNHIAIENPSITERSYGLGWLRTQLPGVVGLIGDNANLWNIEDNPVLVIKDKPLLMIYHQGSTVGYYSLVALFPDTNSAVVIARAIIQALFNFNDDQDYVALVKEANGRTVTQHKQLADSIAELRSACRSLKPTILEPFIGRYTNKSGIFFIDIFVQFGQNDHLLLRFQGLEDYTYELRHLCSNIFEWSLTHDETKKRGRYNIAELPFFLFKFVVDDSGDIVSFSWANNLELPNLEEVFEKDKHNIIGEGGQREQKPIH